MEPLQVFRRRKLEADTGVNGTEGQRDGGRGEEEMAGGNRKAGCRNRLRELRKQSRGS